jgi:predicted nucleotidyltransferase component of viral defense system
MTRLVARSKDLRVDPNVILSRFALERLLYRLSVSPYSERFLLKGATLMPFWLGEAARPTRDADLAGFGDMSSESLSSIFADLCKIDGLSDGIVFDPNTIRVAAIREQNDYGGRRVRLIGKIGRSRIPVQIDIGIGDAVSPPPEEIELPVILDFPPPLLRAYRPETSIAEKFHAIVTLGTTNSRMKDFYDIDRLAGSLSFDAGTLREAIERTFERRGTELLSDVPDGLTDGFVTQKQAEWRAFSGRVGAKNNPRLEDIVASIRGFILPILRSRFDGSWSPGGPWQISTSKKKK